MTILKSENINVKTSKSRFAKIGACLFVCIASVLFVVNLEKNHTFSDIKHLKESYDLPEIFDGFPSNQKIYLNKKKWNGYITIHGNIVSEKSFFAWVNTSKHSKNIIIYPDVFPPDLIPPYQCVVRSQNNNISQDITITVVNSCEFKMEWFDTAFPSRDDSDAL